jgi:hypothetical protein
VRLTGTGAGVKHGFGFSRERRTPAGTTRRHPSRQRRPRPAVPVQNVTIIHRGKNAPRTQAVSNSNASSTSTPKRKGVWRHAATHARLRRRHLRRRGGRRESSPWRTSDTRQ